ncbi:glycosyltransferase family 4 protein [Enterococcus sp. JM9B]|uniref:glycosyltransferase family 4 protein n=1 Tax=Enterococcus sp. JM9B TaxID=1857216 RepID=UPI001374AA8C|nr:glycosyltransferase family 4 protein [Enterococcus sp. JM9B]KAF1303526.1 hypothetical protein BAU16_04055 [Enterococcus sp. JM9B]
MKILYCITRSKWGGAQNHLYELIRAQALKGSDVILVVGDEGDLTKKIHENKIPCRIILMSSLVREISISKDLRSIRKFRKLVKKENPAIVHLHSSKAGAVGRVACINLNVKVIFTAHGWSFTDGVSKKKARVFVGIERFLSGFTDKVICVSKFDYDIANRKNIFKNTTGIAIYNGVPDEYPNLSLERDRNEPINFVMIARFSDVQKRQDLLIDAAKLLSEKGITNYRITFIGDGERLLEAKNKVHAYQLEDKIDFLGFKETPMDYLDHNSVLTLISDYEGLPISIIEGMCMGRPILATDVGGVNELITHGENGYLTSVKPEDIKLFMHKISQLTTDEFQQLSVNSRKLYEKSFTIDDFISSTFRCYTDVL